jgi:hypothetical protein
MFILRDIAHSLQAQFSTTKLGQERASLFVYTLLSMIIPFTSSITSNCLRCLVTLFGIEIEDHRFYTFMASTTLPWRRLWQTVWRLIPSPAIDGRLLVAVDDSINPKIGKKIFGCDTIFDHAAKANQSPYPWAQNIVAVGLLKPIKDRWACLFLDYRFYFAKKTIEAENRTAKIKGKVVSFQTKLAQAGQMLIGIGQSFPATPLLAVTDSWFGNESLWQPVRQTLGEQFHLLSRLHCNSVLYDQLGEPPSGKRGRPSKYGHRLGSATEMAVAFRTLATTDTVNLYGKLREVQAYAQIVMLKSLKCPVRVVWVFRKLSGWLYLPPI